LTLPELDGLSPCEVATRAAKAHQRRTASPVALTCAKESPSLPQAESICLYRFIQEGLNNSQTHAGGQGLAVEVAAGTAGTIVARVSDTGPGFDPEAAFDGLGLSGMRERVVGLGGSLSIDSGPGATVLTAVLPIRGAQ